MQQVINGKLYDTSTAEYIYTKESGGESEKVADDDNPGHYHWDRSSHSTTTIYRTKKGQYFTVSTTTYHFYRTSFWLERRIDDGEEKTTDGGINLISPEWAMCWCKDAPSDVRSRIMKDLEEG